MKKQNQKADMLRVVGSGAALFVSFLICRYGLFEMHGMQELPRNLFTLGLMIISLSALFGVRIPAVSVPVGYMVGFAAGMLLGTDGTDPGGGATNSAWMIWSAVYYLFIAAGFVWDWIDRRKAKKN